jgi:hypothetical protein
MTGLDLLSAARVDADTLKWLALAQGQEIPDGMKEADENSGMSRFRSH